MKKDIVKNLKISIIVLAIFSSLLIFAGAIQLHIKTLTQTGSNVGFTDVIEKFTAINIIFRTPTKVMHLSHPHRNFVVLLVYLMPLVLSSLSLIKVKSNRVSIIRFVILAILFAILPFVMLQQFKSINDYYYRILLDGTQIFDVKVKPDDTAILFFIFNFSCSIILILTAGRLVLNEIEMKNKKVKK